MCDLLQRVQQYIKTYNLITPQSLVLTAVSGGADSRALLHILAQLQSICNFTLHIAHLNHQLRPTADRDAAFVANLATSYNLPMTQHSANVAELAKKEKRSLEDAARQARRRFLLETAKTIGASHIALGHTQNDQAETLLFRLLRGTSLTGLAAMRPSTDNVWIRPLLDITRSQIENYAQLHNLKFCTDESNNDVRFARNKIRHELLPHLKANYTPKIERALSRLSNLAQDDDDLLENLSQEAFQKATLYTANQKIILDVKQIFGYHISLRRRLIKKALFELGISENSLTFDTISRLMNGLDQPRARMHISADLSAYHQNGLLIFARPASPFNAPINPLGETPFPTQNARIITKQYAKSNCLEPKHSTEYSVSFDTHQLPTSLYIREVRPGDHIQPFGLNGTKKVSKLLVDHKIPRALRDEVAVLVGDQKILWVLGICRSNVAPITSKTTHIQQMIFEGGWQRFITHPEMR